MNESKKENKKQKDRITITISSENLKQLDDLVLKHNYRNRSHAVETAIENIVVKNDHKDRT